MSPIGQFASFARRHWLALAVFLSFASFMSGRRLVPILAQQEKVSDFQRARDRLGFTNLANQLGDDLPTGKGIKVGHVEGGRGNYLPNYRDPIFKNVDVTPRSGRGQESKHATEMAKWMYGSYGLANGVTEVSCFRSGHWLTDGMMNTGGERAPELTDCRVFNHSWINKDSSGGAINALRRIDYIIDQRDVLMVAGVNNKRETAVPPLVASGHNVIAVGSVAGNNSGGYTTIEVPGRCKPDIVGQRGTTSASTAQVTAIVACLLETADRIMANNGKTKIEKAKSDEASDENKAKRRPARQPKRHDIQRTDTIRAVLLAGAAKPHGWKPKAGKPLDEHFGAGLARLDYSYRILTGRRATPGRVADRYAWDRRDLPLEGQSVYELNVEEARGEWSIIVAWNRRLKPVTALDATTRSRVWHAQPRHADFDLRLERIDEDGSATLVAESTSRIDNVEHIYLKTTEPGRYRITVQRLDDHGEMWACAIAWRLMK